MATRNLALRILYTINSSPQYILARSFSPVAATLVGEAPYQYATAPLKACLDAICRSSPELIQDCSRDYSIYVLDPLESSTAPTPISISSGAASSNATNNAHSQAPRGVAVGLGLMSWALEDKTDVVQATGTLIRLPTGQDAVEVIFALRETTATQKPPQQQQPVVSGSGWGASSSSQTNAAASSSRTVHSVSHSHHSAPTDARTMATIASIQMRSQSKRPRAKKPSQKPDPLPSSEADRLMLGQDVYIGPVKKKGRPVRTPTTASFISNETKGHIISNNSGSGIHSDNSMPPPSDPSQSTNAGPTLQDIFSMLASTSAQVADPQAAALSAALGSIDSSSGHGSGQNPDLVNAIKTLLGAVSQQQGPSTQPEPQLAQPCRPRSPDDEIVVLDKENVNPTAFRKRCPDEKPQAPLNVLNGENNRNRKLSNRSNTQNIQSTPPAPPPPSSSSTTTTLGRKRTLSDFMDEREATKQRQKLTSLTERRDAHRLAHTARPVAESSVHRYYPRVVGDAPRVGGTNSYYRTPLECATSPPKPTSSSNYLGGFRAPQNSENSNPFSHRPLMSSPTRPSRAISASSPVRPVASKARKPYIVPVWARTGTATQPRLSEQAQKALEEQEQRKKEERAQRKAMKATSDREQKRQCARTPSPEPSSSCQENAIPNTMQPPRTPKRAPKPPTGPISAMSYPVFANSSPVHSLSAFRTPSTPKRQTPLRVTPRVVSFPVTPTRKGASGSPTIDGSLFTPGGLFTPKTPAAGTRVLSVTCSPTRLRTPRTQIKEPDAHASDGDVEDELDRELDSVMEELTSSQPTPVNDDDDDSTDEDYVPSSSEPSTSATETSETGSCTPTRPTTPPPKEHWQGLPPSSPIPFSSPMQIPLDMDDSDDEERELPMATSEGEQELMPSQTNSEVNSPSDLEMMPSENEQADVESESAPTDQDFNLFPALIDPQQLEDLTTFSSDSNFFDAFSENLGYEFSEAELAAFSDGLFAGESQPVDHDLTQFLESCKSLASVCQSDNGEGNSTVDAASLASFLENVDHEKLAEELQGLYGGCVV